VSGSGGVDREVNSPARAEGGAFPAPGNVRKHAPRGYSKAVVRPSGRTGELTSRSTPRRQPPAAGTLRPRTGNMPDRIGGSAAFTSLRKE